MVTRLPLSTLDAAPSAPGSLLPHALCFQLRPDLVWLHVVSDAVIALAYLMIPAALLWFVARRGRALSFGWALALFAAFITLCGLSHVLDIVTVWWPLYYLQGYEKALTAAVSIGTAIAILPLLPRLLAMRSPEELAEANQRLREEIAVRELAEKDLQTALADMRRAVQELDQFAYITSHDLQAPLRTVSGFAQLLLRRYQPRLEGDALEFIDYIDKGCRQMQQQIQALLELSRVGRGGPRFERQPLGDTVGRAIRALQHAIGDSGAAIVVGPLPEIEANHELLAQLFQHLIDNAIKFRKPGERPHVAIDIEREDEQWHVVVADRGIGIPPEQAENVFAIFRRLHPGEDQQGTGIGLAICRKIAHYHGGEITAEPVSDGTRFHLRIPVSPSAQRRLLLAGAAPGKPVDPAV